MTVSVTSRAFHHGETIPQRYTCQGDDVSPALEWFGIPETAVTLVIICEDPDAKSGVWTHWILYNLPATMTGLPEHVPETPVLENGARQGLNDSRMIGYSGPCPPSGPAHHYRFLLYALDSELRIPGQVHRKDLLAAMDGHILAKGELMGLFAR